MYYAPTLLLIKLLSPTANVDYDNLNTDLTFPRDLTRQCANVQINDDDIVEDDEGFNVRATLSTGAPLGVSVRDAISRVTILDFDSEHSKTENLIFQTHTITIFNSSSPFRGWSENQTTSKPRCP